MNFEVLVRAGSMTNHVSLSPAQVALLDEDRRDSWSIFFWSVIFKTVKSFGVYVRIYIYMYLHGLKRL